MALILTYLEQQAIKPISSNNEKKYNQIAFEVEVSELQDLIGTALLQELQNNQENNTALLNGASFEYCGNTISHRGLRFVMAYLNYSRYLGESYVNDTFSGFKKKTTEQSEFLTEGEIKRLQNEARKVALSEFEIIKKYLDTVKYSLWLSSESKKAYTPRFYSVRKTYR